MEMGIKIKWVYFERRGIDHSFKIAQIKNI